MCHVDLGCSHKKFVNDEEMSQELTKGSMYYLSVYISQSILFSHTRRCTSYTAKIQHKRASNIKTNRAFVYSNTKEVLFEWDDFLKRVAGTYADALLCNHVCRANVYEVHIMTIWLVTKFLCGKLYRR